MNPKSYTASSPTSSEPQQNLHEILSRSNSNSIQIDIDEIEGPDQAYTELDSILSVMFSLLIDQGQFSGWWASTLLLLVPPIVRKNDNGKYVVLFGYRQVVIAICQPDLDKIRVRLVSEISEVDAKVLAYSDVVGISMSFGVRPGGNGLGRLMDGFNVKSPLDKDQLRKMLPTATSRRAIEVLMGFTAQTQTQVKKSQPDAVDSSSVEPSSEGTFVKNMKQSQMIDDPAGCKEATDSAVKDGVTFVTTLSADLAGSDIRTAQPSLFEEVL